MYITESVTYYYYLYLMSRGENQISEKIGKIKIKLARSIPLGEISPNPKRFFKLTYLFTNSVPE